MGEGEYAQEEEGRRRKKRVLLAPPSSTSSFFLSFFLFTPPPLSHLVEVLEKEFDQYDWQEEERKEREKKECCDVLLPSLFSPAAAAGRGLT